jgi:hypothetical protein
MRTPGCRSPNACWVGVRARTQHGHDRVVLQLLVRPLVRIGRARLLRGVGADEAGSATWAQGGLQQCVHPRPGLIVEEDVRVALALLVRPCTERPRREPLFEAERHPDRIEPISRDTCLAAKVFHRQRRGFLEQHLNGARPGSGEEVRCQLRVARHRRLAEARADRLELCLRQATRRKCTPKRAEPLIDDRHGGSGRALDIADRLRHHPSELVARLDSPRHIGPPEPSDVLHERRAGSQTLPLRQAVVAEVS